MQLDGAVMSAALFTPYAGCAGLSCAKTTVASGTHTFSSSAGFIAYAYGTGTGESYAFSVSSVSLPVNQNDSLICSSGPLTLTSPMNLVNAVWTAASDPGTTIATGNSYSFTPTQNDTYSVDGELPVSGCPEHFQWQVGVPAQHQFVGGA